MSITPRIQVAGVATRAVPRVAWPVPRTRRLVSGRPLLRGLSLAVFLIGWHLATTYQLDFYVRFHNIPTPARVVSDALTLFAMLTIGVLGMISSTLIRLAGAWLMPWRPRSAKEE